MLERSPKDKRLHRAAAERPAQERLVTRRRSPWGSENSIYAQKGEKRKYLFYPPQGSLMGVFTFLEHTLTGSSGFSHIAWKKKFTEKADSVKPSPSNTYPPEVVCAEGGSAFR